MASLERNVGHLNKRIDDAFDELESTQSKQTEALEKEKQERAAEDARIASKLETSGTGGLHISAIGALWLLIGVTQLQGPSKSRDGSNNGSKCPAESLSNTAGSDAHEAARASTRKLAGLTTYRNTVRILDCGGNLRNADRRRKNVCCGSRCC